RRWCYTIYLFIKCGDVAFYAMPGSGIREYTKQL
ncbi:MAG: hypothetical protein ACI9C4_002486, partial [Paraglaciecola sp.]